jgi:tricarballylate dehydrogenase
MSSNEYGVDVVVVGAGNAAMCAALAAAERGASVVVLERAPIDMRGGNSAFTGGAFRVAYDSADDIRRIVPDLTDQEMERSDFGRYSTDMFFDDLARLSEYRVDPGLAEVLVSESLDTVLWMQRKGVRFIPIYGRQAFDVNGKQTFWGGLTVEVSGGGVGLVEALHRAAEKAGITVKYGARAAGLIREGDRVTGVRWIKEGCSQEIRAGAVVLAAGGFHANAEWRARYLGRDWDLAKVRGSRFNNGDGIAMAIEAGAMPFGHWSGCHAVAFDMDGIEPGDINILGQQKNGFPFGILVNARGQRFFDEGADFRNYTYSKLGHAILAQPRRFAWQVFDAQVTPLLTDEYRIRQITRVEAITLDDLASKMEGVDPQGFLEEIRRYNAAVDVHIPFNPAVKDGRSAKQLPVPKTNWANRIEKPPFLAFGVTCGITFTYGGVRTDGDARVLTAEGEPVEGLYAAGEMVGGLYYLTYPGGAGLMSGSVFGRRAGYHASARRD